MNSANRCVIHEGCIYLPLLCVFFLIQAYRVPGTPALASAVSDFNAIALIG